MAEYDFNAPRLFVDARLQAGARIELDRGQANYLLNVLRLLFSRVAEHLCPNGHRQQPTIDVAAGLDLTCGVCGVTFTPPAPTLKPRRLS